MIDAANHPVAFWLFVLLGTVLATAGAFYYFLVWQPAHSPNYRKPPKDPKAFAEHASGLAWVVAHDRSEKQYDRWWVKDMMTEHREHYPLHRLQGAGLSEADLKILTDLLEDIDAQHIGAAGGTECSLSKT